MPSSRRLAERNRSVSLRKALEFFLIGGTCLVLAIVPLPLGSNRDWAWGPLALVVGVLTLTTALGAPIASWPSLSNVHRLWLPGSLLSLVLLWAIFQLSPLAPQAWRNPFLDSAGLVIGVSIPSRIALNPSRGWESFLLLLTYVCMFGLVAILATQARVARWLLIVIVAAATAYTAWALVDEMLRRSGAYGSEWQHKIFIGLTGPFVNRGNYAAYAGLAGVIALSQLLSFDHYSGRHLEPIAARWRRRLQFFMGAGGLYLGALTVLSAGVLMSWSRGAAISYFAGLLLVILLAAAGNWRRVWYFSFAVLLLAMATLLPGAEGIRDRLTLLVNDPTGGRWPIAQLTIRAIEVRPFLGWGMGAFSDLYPVFQPPELPLLQNRAHNTYLETVLELGIPGAVSFFAAIACVIARCALGLRERSQDRDLPAVAIAATTLVAVNSLVDFSVQIPAVAITYSAILGIGWAQSWSHRRMSTS